jgi:hypothetical protein
VTTQSSFYGDTPNYATDYPTQNDSNTNPANGNTPAPSSFYPNGTVYATLADADALTAEIDADLAAAQAAQAAAAASAAAAAASLAAMSPSNATPIVNGTAAPGVSTNFSRGDHVHPTDTSRAPVASPTFTGTATAATFAVTGTSTFSGAISAQSIGCTGVTATGPLAGTGLGCRTGITGSFGSSLFNTNWTGSALQCWIDATNLGTFNITSDYRIKKDVTNYAGSALEEVLQWRPITYTGKAWGVYEDNDTVRHSFIAHELQAVSPDCVIGEKDAEQPQSLDLVPIVTRLAKAVQELDAQNKALQQDITQLKTLLK